MSDIRPFYGQGEAVQIREKSEVEQLRDENARLRGALEVIQKSCNAHDEYDSWLLGIIQAALDGGKGVQGAQKG